MNTKPTLRERKHLARIKEMACVICDEPGPSEAHHISQKSAYHCVPLCVEHHRGRTGIHGERHAWKLRKMDELDALAVTIERLVTA